MSEYYDDIYRILKNNWDEPGLEFFWCRDASSTVEEVTDSFAKDLEKKTVNAYQAMGFLYWTYGDRHGDLKKARQMMTNAYMLADEKQKKKYTKYIIQIEKEISDETDNSKVTLI